ncbi:HesA/MoeB/ThiF family protein [Sphingobium algorifonticola]|uniref:HesA/MoeB/ThiF family protein n=1 Tax=Sphingobium algorifonticola TaxID=2008318 RepID=A0A437J900_9SPHN|nr:HesA/MoeB/ThiF family protein [Sphingobium algorifonticola]RVT41792.1 HesA/MoeB/ThiF family protein [Sphingobium algorifonticola]
MLTDEQLDRYARHIVLKEIGGAGQARLLSAHVALIGAGGIGSPAIQYLAAAGVGTLRVIDDDAVALSNLQRQVLFGTADIGAPKAEAAARAVARLTPDVRIIPIVRRLDADNAALMLRDADVIVDGSDSFATRLAVADAARALRIPLVSAAVGPFEGQIAVYRGWEADKPCYRCLVGDDPARAEASCADQGVIGALTGVMGSLAALEAIRAIVPFGDDSAGKLLIADLLSLRFRTLTVPKDPACPACAPVPCVA